MNQVINELFGAKPFDLAARWSNPSLTVNLTIYTVPSRSQTTYPPELEPNRIPASARAKPQTHPSWSQTIELPELEPNRRPA